MMTTYHKVKGHAGHEFNEYADSLARQGAMKGFTGEMINHYKDGEKSVSL
jgi:ribonuclease HI